MRIDESIEFLESAVDKHKPSTIVALTSWGYDSQVSTHLTYEWVKKYGNSVTFKIATIDTGINADGYIEWVKEQAKNQGYTMFQLVGDPEKAFADFVENVKEYGFGYTPKMHVYYYNMLKNQAIRAIVRENKKFWTDRILLVTGIRRLESKKRLKAPSIRRHGAAVYLSPLVNWTFEDTIKYRRRYRLPDNPFYKISKGSGDCLCNWGQFISWDKLKEESPKLALKLLDLQKYAIKHHGYGYGERPDQYIEKNEYHLKTPQERLEELEFDEVSLCATCNVKANREVESSEFIELQRSDWSEE